jgi:hypothetical protein
MGRSFNIALGTIAQAMLERGKFSCEIIAGFAENSKRHTRESKIFTMKIVIRHSDRSQKMSNGLTFPRMKLSNDSNFANAVK